MLEITKMHCIWQNKGVVLFLVVDAFSDGELYSQEDNNQFEFCDVVTMTRHNSLRGHRAGMIFTGRDPDLQRKFKPSNYMIMRTRLTLQSFHLFKVDCINQIAALAVAFEASPLPQL